MRDDLQISFEGTTEKCETALEDAAHAERVRGSSAHFQGCGSPARLVLRIGYKGEHFFNGTLDDGLISNVAMVSISFFVGK